jgi:hypothetical protein
VQSALLKDLRTTYRLIRVNVSLRIASYTNHDE